MSVSPGTPGPGLTARGRGTLSQPEGAWPARATGEAGRGGLKIMSNPYEGRRSSMLDWTSPAASLRTLVLTVGVAMVVLGVMAILAPYIATIATTFFLGGVLLADGALRLVHAIEDRRSPGFAWTLLSAILYGLVGFAFIAFPIGGMVTLTVLLGTFFVIGGFVKTIRSFQLRGQKHWGWILFDGLVTLALGIILWTGFPATALWAVGLIIGVDALVSGMSLLGVYAATGRALPASTGREELPGR